LIIFMSFFSFLSFAHDQKHDILVS
jgi:hypothetical protein